MSSRSRSAAKATRGPVQRSTSRSTRKKGTAETMYAKEIGAEGGENTNDLVGDVVTVPQVDAVISVTPVSIGASVAMTTDGIASLNVLLNENATNIENVLEGNRVHLFERAVIHDTPADDQLWPVCTRANDAAVSSVFGTTVPTGTIPKTGLRPTNVRPTWTTTNSIIQSAAASTMPNDGENEPHWSMAYGRRRHSKRPGVPTAVIPLGDTALDMELDVLRKNHELLLLKAEIQSMELALPAAVSTQINRRLNFSDVEDALAPFTGDDAYGIKKWLLDFEIMVATLGYGDLDKILIAKRRMKGSARLFANTMGETHTWIEFKQQMMDEFDRHITLGDIYRQLAARKRGKDESFHHFILSMKEIASQGVVEELELVRFIVDGLNDRSPQAAMLYCATNIRQLKDMMDNYDYHKSRLHVQRFRRHLLQLRTIQYR